jgi:pyruvate kinase
VECRTKIVATLGPASTDPSVLTRLLAAGVDVVRLNLSHGRVDEHLAVLASVRTIAASLGLHTAVLADLPGPKVRAGAFAEGGAMLRSGATVRLVPGDGPSDHHTVVVEYPTLLDDLHPGDRVVVGDGAITLSITDVLSTGADAVVVTGGVVQGRPGVHLPSERMRLSSPTADDLELAVVMADAGADFLAVSFVRSPDDLVAVRRTIDARLGSARAGAVRLVAKIETLGAVERIDEIAAVADAVMVARGDLGIECPLEDVPHLQKRIIRTCVERGVPVITATQVMESMISSPSPTRAEVSDIANAVFDGTDALMLSAETAIGADPVNVIDTMVRVAARAERELRGGAWSRHLERQLHDWGPLLDDDQRVTLSITQSAGQIARDVGAAAILCCTRGGRSARAMARCRPEATLVGLSPDTATLRSLGLSWGMHVVAVELYRSTDEMVWFAVERALQAGLIAHGDVVLVLAGAPDPPDGFSTDVVRIVRVR